LSFRSSVNLAAPARCCVDGIAEHPLSLPVEWRTLTSFEWRPIRYRNVHLDSEESLLCRRLRVWQEREAHRDRRWSCAQELWRTASRWGTVEVHQAIIMRLHQLGGVRTQSGVLAGNASAGLGTRSLGRGGALCCRSYLLCALRSSAQRSIHRSLSAAIYRCEQPNVQLGQRRCLSVAGKRIDETIAAEMLRAVAPMAIEAAWEADRMLKDEAQDRRRIAELELQQAQYDASLADAAMPLATLTIV